MKFNIENETISVAINQKGAEFAGIKSKASGTEYLWQADPAHWGRHSCILFPFVGRLKNDEYKFEGKTYQLPQHGFARNLDFEIESQSKSHISLVLKESEETLKTYPFSFVLKAIYEVKGNTLSIGYEVENPSDNKDLYFSIGAHPAFNCPIDPAKKRSDYQLVFSEKETAKRLLIGDGGLYTGETEKTLDNQDFLPITDNLFAQDALVFDSLKSDTISIQSGSELPKLSVGFKGFPHMGIWSKNSESPFVCIEPWFGLADSTDHNGDFTKKTGMIKLAPKGKFSCEHTVSIEE
ncbi:aldose 1-epimerase family protein [Flammeovirgaceae bacterium SG7u.111]|nr:aldose 1-epimerase family protein [Flammeovirgaceae bacterium SG7u.132]WPO33163.1 aldose 1-epimerase family protein [Flammeovirgaceae bacterium SG7u.111]